MLSSSTVCSRSELVSCGKSQSKDIYVLIFYVNPWNFPKDLQSHESLCFLLSKTHVMRVLWSARLGRSQKTDENWGDILGTGKISKWISEQHLSSVFSWNWNWKVSCCVLGEIGSFWEDYEALMGKRESVRKRICCPNSIIKIPLKINSY